MLIVEVYHSHPVLRTFVELLSQVRRESNELSLDSIGLLCVPLLCIKFDSTYDVSCYFYAFARQYRRQDRI